MKKTGLQGYRKNFIKILSVFMVLFPWVTYLNMSLLSETESTVFIGYDGVAIDFFIRQKGVVLLSMAVLCVLWFVGERVLPQKVDNNVPLLKGDNKILFILGGIYTAGAVISTLFSKYPEGAWGGSPTVGESLWVFLGYIVLIFAFYNAFVHEYAFSVVKIAIAVLSGITIVLTLVEWFYKPLLEIGLVQMFVAPAKYAHIVANMKATMFSSAISLTFYNPGYFGGFVCILIPFVLNFFLQEEKLWQKLLYGVLMIGLLFGVVTSNTTTAMYIALLEVVLVLVADVVMKKAQKKALVQGVLAVGVAMAALVLAGVITGNSFINVFSNANSATGTVAEHRFEVEDIQMKGNRLLISGEKVDLQLVYEGGIVNFYDGSGVALHPEYIDNDYVFTEPEYADLKVSVRNVSDTVADEKLMVLIDAGYKSTIDFYILNTGEFAGIGQNMMPISDIGDAGTADSLKGLYGMFTGRGYAWVNSLPVLKDTWFIGKGPGNFAYYFKQFDYAGLLNTHKTVRQIIDKPHSAYIQYAIELGWPAMVAFFGIFVYALAKGMKAFVTDSKRMGENPVFAGAMVAVLGFLIYSLINDSMITVTPVACMVVGLLLGSEYKSR